jgi:low affinity Fe/Cu permease
MTHGEDDKHKISLDRFFSSFAEKAASLAGSPLAFVFAIVFVLACAITGPLVGYSHEWQMVMSEAPAIFTFLLVFLIQSSQNRETRALQLKLNELIRATKGAHTMMLNLEKLTEAELKIMCGEYELLAEEARKRLSRGQTDQHVPEISLSQNAPKE